MSLATDESAYVPTPADSAYLAGPREFVSLLKPRVMSLVVLTALAGMAIAPARPHPLIGFAALTAIAIGAGASGALNMWWDADIDGRMARTRLRAVPSGLIPAKDALAFGLVLSLLSVLTLAAVANFLAAGLLAFTIFYYVVVYTMWLKRLTPQNIVIGGAAGALPPMVGCAAASGVVSWDSVWLFAIIFMWTPPHFWALALVKARDYERVGVPMMPNVKGPDRTRLEILVYSLLLAPLAVVPWFTGAGGLIYGVTAALMGIGFCLHAVRVYLVRDGADANKRAMAMFGYSILYLFALFGILVVEHGFGLISRWGL